MSEPEVLQFIYPFDPVRPELVTDQGAWTEEDVRFGQAHFAYLKQVTQDEMVLLAGRSLGFHGERSLCGRWVDARQPASLPRILG